MELVGFHDLEGRSAYQPPLHAQGGRWIAEIGLHGGQLPKALTGEKEHNGTAIPPIRRKSAIASRRPRTGPTGVASAPGAARA